MQTFFAALLSRALRQATFYRVVNSVLSGWTKLLLLPCLFGPAMLPRPLETLQEFAKRGLGAGELRKK